MKWRILACLTAAAAVFVAGYRYAAAILGSSSAMAA